MAWVATFAGRLKSDISVSPALAYFPVPWPTPTPAQVDQLTEAWEHIEQAQAAHEGATLADLYDRNAMPVDLLTAHTALDHVVDTLVAGHRLATNDERLPVLLRHYSQLPQSDQLKIPERGSRRGR